VINFKIKIADFVFAIETKYEDTKKMCLDYLCDEDSCFFISINDEDLKYEREKSIQEAIYEGRVPEEFSDAYLETIAVYRKIAEYICDKNATVFHGSLISLNNEGYLFTGKSGIGKTTHTQNWLKMYPEAKIINGDKPILKIIDNEVYGYGTPWSGKECLNSNNKVKIKAIIIITRDITNHIEKVKLSEYLSVMLSQIYRANKNDGVKNALMMVASICEKTTLYKVGCNMDIESAKVAYEGINQ